MPSPPIQTLSMHCLSYMHYPNAVCGLSGLSENIKCLLKVIQIKKCVERKDKISMLSKQITYLCSLGDLVRLSMIYRSHR